MWGKKTSRITALAAVLIVAATATTLIPEQAQAYRGYYHHRGYHGGVYVVPRGYAYPPPPGYHYPPPGYYYPPPPPPVIVPPPFPFGLNIIIPFGR